MKQLPMAWSEAVEQTQRWSEAAANGLTR